MPEITAINVFIEADGEQHIAFIDPAMATAFIGMLGVFQPGQPKAAQLSRLPAAATRTLIDTRRALLTHWQRPQQEESQP